MSQNNNTFGSFVKILIGIGLAVLIFMSYMLAEQQGWVNTNIAGRILRGVEDGKAIREEQEAKKAERETVKNDSNSDEKIFGNTIPTPLTTQTIQEEPEKEQPAPVSETDSDDASDDFAEEASDDTETAEDASEDEPEAAEEKTDSKPSTKSAKPKKIDYAEVARKRNAWPKSVQMRVKGTMVSILDKNGNEITKVGVPVGTKLFVRKVTNRGVLEVKSAATGQIFQVHASRTTFSRLYTGKPISDGLVAASDSTSSASSGSSGASSDDSGAADDSDSGNDSDDDFSDDDFFDDDF